MQGKCYLWLYLKILITTRHTCTMDITVLTYYDAGFLLKLLNSLDHTPDHRLRLCSLSSFKTFPNITARLSKDLLCMLKWLQWEKNQSQGHRTFVLNVVLECTIIIIAPQTILQSATCERMCVHSSKSSYWVYKVHVCWD